jgi:SAM-dependent methyltransferase
MPKTAPFEKHSEAYDAWFDQHPDLYQAELEALRGLLPPPPARGMEIGAGTGKFAVPLGIKIGVEPAEQMAARARARGLEVHSGVAERLPFPDRHFDFALMVTTICFLDDVARSLREAFRVLKPGGSLLVGFVDKESDLGRRYADKKQRSKFYRDATFFSPAEVRERLAGAGFRVARVRQTLLPGQAPRVVRDGFGEGAFVVIEARKPAAESPGRWEKPKARDPQNPSPP